MSAAILFAAIAIGPSLAHAQYYIADLNGAGVNPPTDSPGRGFAEGLLWTATECETGGELLLMGSVTDLVGIPQAMVLARGLAGAGSEPIHALSWHQDGSGFTISDTTLVLDREQCLDLRGEDLHILVSTDSFPSGEIAGQLWESPDPAVLPVTWGAIRATYR